MSEPKRPIRKGQIDDVVALAKSDFESRVRVAETWGVPNARALVAKTASEWAAEQLAGLNGHAVVDRKAG